MPIRRRPVRRVAVTGAVGAAAYNAGKNKSAAPTHAAAPAAPAVPPVAPAPAAAAGSDDPIANKVEIYDALAKLGQLKERGLLSEEEFQREKLRLLDS